MVSDCTMIVSQSGHSLITVIVIYLFNYDDTFFLSIIYADVAQSFDQIDFWELRCRRAIICVHHTHTRPSIKRDTYGLF